MLRRLTPIALAALPSLFLACDTRKPMEDDNLVRPPVLELSADREAVGADEDTAFVAVRALLVNAFHATLEGRRIDFSARVGFITAFDTTNAAGVVTAFYFPRYRGTGAPIPDTLIAAFSYQGGTVADTLVLSIVPTTRTASDSVGSIQLFSSRTAVQVKGSGSTSQAVVSAKVLDIFRNPIKDGTRVTFKLLRGPGGGETLGESGASATASTQNGTASVTFQAGTSIGVVEVLAVSQGDSVKQALLTVTSGPPEHIDIMLRPDSLGAGNRWRMQVQAALTDAYLNPVKDSIGVLFTLKAPGTSQSAVSIQGSSLTGNRPCSDTTEAACAKVAGSAFTSLTYRSEVVFDTLEVGAETSTGSRDIRATVSFRAPLQRPIIKAEYFGGAVYAPFETPVDTLTIFGTLTDGFGYAVPAATLCINTDGGTVLDTCRATDALGKASYRMTVTARDQTSISPFRQINVHLFERSTGARGSTSFTAIFQ